MKLNQGFITLQRQILEWEWYNDGNTFRLFIHLLLKANHTDKSYKGTLIKRGTFLTGLDVLSKETGLTVRQVRTCLTRLKSTNEVTIKTSSKGSIVQIVKYNEYQSSTSKTTNQRQTNDKRTTSTNNDNNENNKDIYREFAHLKIYKSEFDKLREKWNKKQIDYILDGVENYRENKKYTSLYLTANKWLRTAHPIKEVIETKDDLTEIEKWEQGQARLAAIKKTY